MQQSVIFSLSYVVLALGFFVFNATATNAQSALGFCSTPSAEEFNSKVPFSSSQSRISSIAQSTFRQLISAPRVGNTAFTEAQERANRGGISINASDLLESVSEGATVYDKSRPVSKEPSKSQQTPGKSDDYDCIGSCNCNMPDVGSIC